MADLAATCNHWPPPGNTMTWRGSPLQESRVVVSSVGEALRRLQGSSSRVLSGPRHLQWSSECPGESGNHASTACIVRV